MTEFLRTPDSNFDGLAEFAFAPHYHTWQDLRMHYVDEGPRDGPPVLLLHGMPTWIYLYRTIIPPLVSAGYRCIAPDHMGFGRSDKPVDTHWYTIARHTEILTSLVTALDLRATTLVCQDWGGPIGLAQAALTPERFARLVIMNTWLHHEGFEYTQAIRNWHRNWKAGGLFYREKPQIGLLLAMSAGFVGRASALPGIGSGNVPALTPAAQAMYDAFTAPFLGLPDNAYNGLRRFPLSIPLAADTFDNGNAVAQALHYRLLLEWPRPVHFIWGVDDDVFTEAWGRTWAARMNATFDPIVGAGHFLQNTHGGLVAERILARAAAVGG